LYYSTRTEKEVVFLKNREEKRRGMQLKSFSCRFAGRRALNRTGLLPGTECTLMTGRLIAVDQLPGLQKYFFPVGLFAGIADPDEGFGLLVYLILEDLHEKSPE